MAASMNKSIKKMDSLGLTIDSSKSKFTSSMSQIHLTTAQH